MQLHLPVGAAARSTPAAVLLNATGLGLGFAYLGRWWRAVLCFAVTALLVLLAFTTDAADLPLLWQTMVVLWLGAMAFAAWRIARRHPQPTSTRGRVVPVVAAVVLVAAMIGGYLAYGSAGARTYADGFAAQSRGDCAAAIPAYDTVDGTYELTLSTDVPAARANRAQCEVFLAATAAEQRGEFAEAVRRYQAFRRDYPDTVLVDYARDNLERSYATWAESLRTAGDYPEAIRVYRELLAEFTTPEHRDALAGTYLDQAAAARAAAASGPGAQRALRAADAVDALRAIVPELADTPTAAAVPQAISDTFTAANALFVEQQFCEAIPVIDYFVSVPQDALTGGIVATAAAERAPAMYECGLAQYRAAAYDDAKSRLQAFLDAYPNDPQVAQARSALIAATVLAESPGTPPIPLPAPLGDNSPGSISVTYYNDSQTEQHVYVAGPTAHEFVLPACGSCPESYSYVVAGLFEPCPDPSALPSLTLRLQPGSYLSFSTNAVDDTTVSTDLVEPGYAYTSCLYIDRLY